MDPTDLVGVVRGTWNRSSTKSELEDEHLEACIVNEPWLPELSSMEMAALCADGGGLLIQVRPPSEPLQSSPQHSLSPLDQEATVKLVLDPWTQFVREVCSRSLTSDEVFVQFEKLTKQVDLFLVARPLWELARSNRNVAAFLDDRPDVARRLLNAKPSSTS